MATTQSNVQSSTRQLEAYRTDRHNLLNYVLSQNSTKLQLPKECTSIDQLNLETIDVKKLLDTLRSGAGSVDLSYVATVKTAKQNEPKPAPHHVNKSLPPPPLPPKPSGNHTQGFPPPGRATTTDLIDFSTPTEKRNSFQDQTFASLHAEIGLAIRKSSASLPGYQPIPQLAPQEWTILKDQFKISCYESLLLSTQLLQIPEQDKETILEVIRPTLEITMKQHGQIMANLAIPGSKSFCTLDYLVALLRNKKAIVSSPNADQMQDLKLFRERQASKLFNGLMSSVLNTFKATSWPLKDKQIDSIELIDNIKHALDTMMIVEGEEYNKQLEHLETYFNCIKATTNLQELEIPKPLAIKIYEMLVQAYFEPETSHLHSNKKDIDSALGHYCKAFGLSPNVSAICFTRWVYLGFKKHFHESGLLPVLKEQLNCLFKLINLPDHEAQLFSATTKEIMEWLRSTLWDYRKLFDPPILTDLILLYKEMFQRLSPNSSFEQEISSMMISSAKKQYDRLVANLRPMDFASFSGFLPKLEDEITFEAEYYANQFAAYTSTPFFLQEFARNYTLDSNYIFRNETTLTMEAADLQPKMQHIQEVFQSLNVQASLLPDLVAIYSPLVTAFTDQQEKHFAELIDRALFLESWEPVSEHNKHSSSVQDMFQMFAETSPFVVPLTLPALVEFFLGTLCGVINRMIQKYIGSIMEPTTAKSGLLPVSANEEVKGKKESMIVNLVKRRDSYIPPLSSAVVQKVAVQKLAQLCVRVNNLHFAIQNINLLQQDFKSKGSKMKLQINENYYNNMFASSTSLAEKSIIALMQYIGTKIAFYDLRTPLIEDLYIPTTTQGPRMSTLFTHLDQILSTICQTVSGDITNDVIAWVYRQILQAYEYVLLYSGPDRLFEPKDADTLLEDLLALNAFFISKDDKGTAQGLKEELVNGYCATLKTIISNMFEFATDYLIEHYANASVDPHQILSKQKILCVLVHRSDKKAKEFVKLQKETQIYKSIKKGSIVLQ